MKIKRIIQGQEVEIELTSEELRAARWVSEEEYDKQYVIDLADCYGEEEVKKILKNDPEIRGKLARRFRRYMDDQVDGEAEYNCFRWAVDDCLDYYEI